MKNMARLFYIAVAAALTTSAANAAPVHVSSLVPQHALSVERVRLVCDQDCRCWHTRYQQRNNAWKVDDRERWNPNYCPGGGYYNGHYRTGPGIGLSFESRFPVRGYPFPF